MNNHMGAHGVHLPTDAPLPLVASAALVSGSRANAKRQLLGDSLHYGGSKNLTKLRACPAFSIALFTVLAAIARWLSYRATYAQLSRVVLEPLTQCPLALRVRRFIRSSECLLRRFLDAGITRRFDTLSEPASKKRQGTKSQRVGQRLAI